MIISVQAACFVHHHSLLINNLFLWQRESVTYTIIIVIQLLVIYIKFSKKGMMQAFFQLQLGSLPFEMHSPQSEKKHWNKTPMSICRCIHAHKLYRMWDIDGSAKQDDFTTLWEFYITVLSVGDETMQ